MLPAPAQPSEPPRPATITPAAAALAPATQQLRLDAPLLVGMLALISLAPIVGFDLAHRGGRGVLAGLLALTVVAAATGRPRSLRLGLALIATTAAFALPWELNWWPVPGAVGVVVYLIVGKVARSPADPRFCLRLGRITRIDLLLIAGLATVSTLFLLGFQALTPAHPALVGGALISAIPRWLIGAAAIGFATGNAAVEELLFRGAILHHLRYAFGVWPAVVVQAAVFGALHLHGYPYGPIGVAGATVYGLLLGAVRLRCDGLLAPWVAHVVADSVIFIIILQTATRSS